MRICRKCGEQKEVEKFRKCKIWYSHTCKSCYAAQYRKGTENTGRFKSGHIPWSKGKDLSDHVSKKEKKVRVFKRDSEHRQSIKSSEWALKVKNRDGFKCVLCGKCDENNRMHAHHIIAWKEDEEKRFELDNGMTLCISCHSSLERLEEIKSGKFDWETRFKRKKGIDNERTNKRN